MGNGFFQTENRAGEPLSVGNIRLVPFSRFFRLSIPGQPIGLIWNRPASVLVQYEDGSEQVLPVRDLTRLVQWLIFGVSLLFPIMLWSRKRRIRTRGGSES